MAAFKIGDKVKDTISGYTGIAVCETRWLHGCTRWGIQPDKLDKDGKPGETMMFDEPQIVLVKAREVERKTDTGGPRPRIEMQRR